LLISLSRFFQLTSGSVNLISCTKVLEKGQLSLGVIIPLHKLFVFRREIGILIRPDCFRCRVGVDAAKRFFGYLLLDMTNERSELRGSRWNPENMTNTRSTSSVEDGGYIMYSCIQRFSRLETLQLRE
jgi:hypothetical protein